MKFIECYVENFGKLHALRYGFDKGLNSILADNGYGKTTLSVFIKCMLYGMEDTKKQGLDENDRKHYMPWQGGRCGGYLSLETGGHRYRIERSFAVKAAEDSFALYDLDTGLPSADFSADFGTEALGIDRDGFERTVFLSERNLWGKNENKSISAKLSDLADCDGDIGGLDEALSRLEEKRKFYHKNGGKGEIGEIKAKITALELEIADAERLREEAFTLERSLAALVSEERELEDKKSRLDEKLDGLRALKSRSALTEQYTERLAELTRERTRLAELRAVFGESIPTAEEIDAARYKLNEADSLERTAELYTESPRYAELSARFEGKTDLSEVEAMVGAAKSLVEAEKRLSALPQNEPAVSKYFSRRVPARSELELKINQAKRSFALTFIIGSLTLLLGIALIFILLPVGIAAAALGTLLIVFSGIASARRTRETEAFLSELSDEPIPCKAERIAYLEFLLLELSRCEGAISSVLHISEERARLSEQIASTRAALVEFLAKIGVSCEGDLAEAVRSVREDYLSYYKLLISAESSVENKRGALARAQTLKKEANAFIERFAIESDAPFDALKRLLTEYNYLLMSSSKLEGECEELKARYGIEDNAGPYNPEKLIAAEERLGECVGLLTKKRREITLLETRLAGYSERIEKIYELLARREELSAALSEAEHRLDIIRKTKSALTEAKDLMTAKYLGRTREGFEKYRSIIDGTDTEREFSLDTSFSLSVTEGGATHQHAAYSKGTRELYALATRLALSDALYDGELPPLILDDPFSSLDDRRVNTAKKLLLELAKKRQIIYFTCHKSRSLN